MSFDQKGEVLFKIEKSHLQYLYFLCVHLFAVTCCWVAFPIDIAFFLSAGILLSLLYYLNQASSVRAIEYVSQREWILYQTNNQVDHATLLPSSVMWRHLMILYFVKSGTRVRKTVVIFSDSFALTQFRALRRCIRLGFL